MANKFKIGDIVRIITGPTFASIKHRGSKIKVISNAILNPSHGKKFYTIDCTCGDELRTKCCVWEYEMVLLKKDLINETDYLDAFKQNFQDGV